jgi:transposase
MIQGWMKCILDATPIALTSKERAERKALARSQTTQHRQRQRTRIVLMADDGAATREIARTVRCTIGTASKSRVRLASKGMAGLRDAGERGAVPKCGPEHDARILELLDRRPPAGYSNSSGPLLSAALGDIHVQYIWRFLRAQKIDLSGRKSWCVSNDPDFVAKAAEIVGLYMAPPDNAIVFSVDEKPSIQALKRRQGYLKFPDGRAMTGQSHDYKRHGTTTLLAALDLASGKVVGEHRKRRRRIEFLNLMNQVVAAHPAREIRVILDNLSTHKPKRGMWLRRHKNVRFHYTPTHSSWLNQIEIWFSILAGKSLDGASSQSVPALIAHIDAFIASYNETARPFVWTKSAVHQKRPKPCFADQ